MFNLPTYRITPSARHPLTPTFFESLLPPKVLWDLTRSNSFPRHPCDLEARRHRHSPEWYTCSYLFLYFYQPSDPSNQKLWWCDEIKNEISDLLITSKVLHTAKDFVNSVGNYYYYFYVWFPTLQMQEWRLRVGDENMGIWPMIAQLGNCEARSPERELQEIAAQTWFFAAFSFSVADRVVWKWGFLIKRQDYWNFWAQSPLPFPLPNCGFALQDPWVSASLPWAQDFKYP